MKSYNTVIVVIGFVVSSAHESEGAVKYAKVGGATTGNCDTWTNACTMDRAISLAASGDSVWAKKTAGGSPYGPIDLKNGVKVIGGFAGTETQPSQSNPTTQVTTIDGGGTQQCVFSANNSSSTVLRGFTISNCVNGNQNDWDGGGALVIDSSDAMFVNCIFENNTSVRTGGGVAIRGTGSPKFFNCIFRNNGSGTSGSAQDDDVAPMAGGAVYLHSGSPTFVNCLFYNNKAAGGAALSNMGGTPTFVNCTFTKNHAKYSYGGALFDESGKAVLRNCILWGNTAIKGANQILNAPTVSTAATYTNVQGGWTGTGNLNTDPLFANAGSNDYRITCNSSCKDAGVNSSPTLPDDVGDLDWDTITSEPIPKDLALVGRINGTVDMGAYELWACMEE